MSYQRLLLKTLQITNGFLRRVFPKAFDMEQKYPGGFPKQMTLQAAYNILGASKNTSD